MASYALNWDLNGIRITNDSQWARFHSVFTHNRLATFRDMSFFRTDFSRAQIFGKFVGVWGSLHECGKNEPNVVKWPSFSPCIDMTVRWKNLYSCKMTVISFSVIFWSHSLYVCNVMCRHIHWSADCWDCSVEYPKNRTRSFRSQMVNKQGRI